MSAPVIEPVVLTGRFVRLEPLTLTHVPALDAAAAEDRATYDWTPVPDGEARPPGGGDLPQTFQIEPGPLRACLEGPRSSS